MEQEKKKGSGCLVKLIIGIAALALVGYGLVMPGKELPAISLAAELIPVNLPIPGFEHGIPNTLPTAIFTTLFLIIIAFSYSRAEGKIRGIRGLEDLDRDSGIKLNSDYDIINGGVGIAGQFQ